MSLVTCSTAGGEDLQVHPEVLGDSEGARLYLVLPRRAGQGQFKRPEPVPSEDPNCRADAIITKHRKQVGKHRAK